MAQVRAAADVINIKIAKAGGLYQSKKIAAVAEAAGLECVIGTAWGLGIKVAAKLHPAAATRSLRDGVEFTELMLHDLLLAGPQAADLAPPFSDGYLDVPLGPGLGVTLDEEQSGSVRAGCTADSRRRPPTNSRSTTDKPGLLFRHPGILARPRAVAHDDESACGRANLATRRGAEYLPGMPCDVLICGSRVTLLRRTYRAVVVIQEPTHGRARSVDLSRYDESVA